jgi:hypothetical protein
VRALLYDPGGITVASALCGDGDAAFRICDVVGFHDALVSGLNHTARTLAVYASQPPLRADHARLATGLVA